MTSSGDVTAHFELLMTIARKNRVQVCFFSGQQCPNVTWDGLYVVTPNLGAGIAINSDLDPLWRDWVLGHELGHHFGNLHGMLFSPFGAHKVDPAARKRWGRLRALDPEEEKANEWAVTTLVNDDSWDMAEQHSPVDLRQIVDRLRLPFPAALAWERRQRRRVRGERILLTLDPGAKEILRRPVTGKGGHQSFFSRVKPRGNTLPISYSDFSYARERAAVVQGGWLTRYQAVLQTVKPELLSEGTSRALFKL